MEQLIIYLVFTSSTLVKFKSFCGKTVKYDSSKKWSRPGASADN